MDNSNMILDSRYLDRRSKWVKLLQRPIENFSASDQEIEKKLQQEIEQDGISALLEHLALCGTVPEGYPYDSTEEKLYSKYTDTLISVVFKTWGLKSEVLTERADAADVDVIGERLSFVADSKAFRMSRTAKNQKDFKIESMASWKGDKDHAMVVSPIFHLPIRSSQIYEQALRRKVCILTYTHLRTLTRGIEDGLVDDVEEWLDRIFKSSESLSPTKSAETYWSSLNRAMLSINESIREAWELEKEIAIRALNTAAREAREWIDRERESENKRIKGLERAEAISELINIIENKLERRVKVIERLSKRKLIDYE